MSKWLRAEPAKIFSFRMVGGQNSSTRTTDRKLSSLQAVYPSPMGRSRAPATESYFTASHATTLHCVRATTWRRMFIRPRSVLALRARYGTALLANYLGCRRCRSTLTLVILRIRTNELLARSVDCAYFGVCFDTPNFWV
jgi:hypothetical protein